MSVWKMRLVLPWQQSKNIEKLTCDWFRLIGNICFTYTQIRKIKYFFAISNHVIFEEHWMNSYITLHSYESSFLNTTSSSMVRILIEKNPTFRNRHIKLPSPPTRYSSLAHCQWQRKSLTILFHEILYIKVTRVHNKTGSDFHLRPICMSSKCVAWTP